VLAGVGLDFRRGAFQRVASLFQPQLGIPEFEVFINVVEERQHVLFFCMAKLFSKTVNKESRNSGKELEINIPVFLLSLFIDWSFNSSCTSPPHRRNRLAGRNLSCGSRSPWRVFMRLTRPPSSRRRAADFGYAYGLVKLTDQPNVGALFISGWWTGFLCYAPQLFFFWHIFSVVSWCCGCAGVLVGLFAAMVCGCARRWARSRRVADSDNLDGRRILPQRTLLPEILVAECRICVAGAN